MAKWCPARDLNPHALRRQDLNLLRLPIPPAGPFRPYSRIAGGNEGIQSVAEALRGRVGSSARVWPMAEARRPAL